MDLGGLIKCDQFLRRTNHRAGWGTQRIGQMNLGRLQRFDQRYRCAQLHMVNAIGEGRAGVQMSDHGHRSIVVEQQRQTARVDIGNFDDVKRPLAMRSDQMRPSKARRSPADKPLRRLH